MQLEQCLEWRFIQLKKFYEIEFQMDSRYERDLEAERLARAQGIDCDIYIVPANGKIVALVQIYHPSGYEVRKDEGRLLRLRDWLRYEWLYDEAHFMAHANTFPDPFIRLRRAKPVRRAWLPHTSRRVIHQEQFYMSTSCPSSQP